jgi:PD-(D/E)XK nuclease superfamily
MDAVIAQDNKSFSWSYSRLHGFETCPRKYYETQVLKDKWPEDRSAMLDWGDDVHIALAAALKNNTPLPLKFQLFEHWLDKVRRTPGEMLIEDDARWACTRAFRPTPWFAPNVWLRAIADVAKIDGDIALIVDWKSGKSANVDPIQMTLASLMAMVQFPKLQLVRGDFVWLQEDRQTSQNIYRRDAADHWAELLPRVERFRTAIERNDFPPTPNYLCGRYCSVLSCDHNGRKG